MRGLGLFGQHRILLEQRSIVFPFFLAQREVGISGCRLRKLFTSRKFQQSVIQTSNRMVRLETGETNGTEESTVKGPDLK